MGDDDAWASERAKRRHLEQAHAVIDDAGTELDLAPEVVTFATQTYTQVLEARETRYWDIDVTAMAVLYVAAKTQGVAVTPAEITRAGAGSISRKRLLRRTTDIDGLLDIDLEALYDASVYVDRYAEELAVDESTRERAQTILDICETAGIAAGKRPGGWAAAALYLAAIEHDTGLTQETVAATAEVSPLTIRRRYQEQRDAVLEATTLPSDAAAGVAWYAERIGIRAPIQDRARGLLAAARDAGCPVDDSPVWAAAALRQASVELEDRIGRKALKIPIAVEWATIETAMEDLQAAGQGRNSR